MEGNLVLDLYVWVRAPCILISGKRKVLMGGMKDLNTCVALKKMSNLSNSA